MMLKVFHCMTNSELLMLFHKIEEIEAIYPTSKWNKFSKLVPMLSMVERIKLSKVLGVSLLKRLNEEYDKIIAANGSLYEPEKAEVEGVPGIAFDLISSCHQYILFVAVSNNVHMLSMSFNSGGGFNKMEGADYGSADDKSLESLRKERWMNAMDSLESILLILEEDARNERHYTEQWKESPYFYEQGDLLITTAQELNRFVSIDSSRERYIALVAVLRQCQDTYLVARLGVALVKALVERKYENFTSVDGDESKDSGNPNLWKSLRSYASAALANYMANEVKSLKTDRSMQNGDEQIALAIQVVIRNAEVFEEYIPGTPLDYEFERVNGCDYETWKKRKEEENVTNVSDECECKVKRRRWRRVCDNPYSSIADFGGLLHSK